MEKEPIEEEEKGQGAGSKGDSKYGDSTPTEPSPLLPAPLPLFQQSVSLADKTLIIPLPPAPCHD